MKSLAPLERKSSFNPEAAAFSPITTVAQEAGEFTVAPGGTDFVSSASQVSVPVHQDPPLHYTKSKCQAYFGDSKLAPIPVRLEDFFSKEPPLDVGMETTREKSSLSTRGTMGSSYHEHALSQPAINVTSSYIPNFLFSPHHTDANFHAIDMNELSVSLGLPGGKKYTKLEECSAHAHNSYPSQKISDTVYGNLIDRALDKPLTASALAHYMKSQSESSEETIKAFQEPQELSERDTTPTQEHGQALKVVRPPPSFDNQISRMVTIEGGYTPTGSAAMQQNIAHSAPFGYLHQHRTNLGQPTAYFPHHARRPSIKRRPQRHTRTKRTDQGPEPSAADIYPDDAHWTSTQFSHSTCFEPSPFVALPPQAIVRVEDATNWPTPAEVYTHESQASQVALAQQKTNVYEAHATLTAEDMSAADSDVLSLIAALPKSTINMLIPFGAVDLIPDGCSLSPGQESGRRYGMNFFGIGISDDWQAPPAVETDAFRVRPRDHEGWGGWEWAIKRGWADE